MLKSNQLRLQKVALLFIVNFSLPVLVSRPSFASTCSSATVDQYVNQLQGLNQTQVASLVECGSSAVPDLIAALKDTNQQARRKAADTLGWIGSDAQSAVNSLIQVLQDRSNSVEVRTAAVYALGNIASKDQGTISALLALLKQDSSPEVRAGAAYALGQNRATEKAVVLELVKVLDSLDEDTVRSFAARSLGEIAEQERSSVQPFASSTLIKVIQNQNQDISVLAESIYALGAMLETSENAIATLINTFNQQDGTIQINSALALQKIAKFLISQAHTNQAIETVLPTLIKIQATLGEPQPDIELGIEPDIRQAQQSVADNIQELKNKQTILLNQRVTDWLISGKNIGLAHIAFWLLLIFAYPKSPQIQAIFFWNPWVRKIFGLGYVSFCLTWIPFLRHRLFEPFQTSLLMDARLQDFNPEAYFLDAQVERENQASSEPGSRLAIAQAIPQIKGQIILEGKSGLGKSMFLRYLLTSVTTNKGSGRIAVYLPATKCDAGVIEAIKEKLHGEEIKDSRFLESLIYSGAIDICIDGLNEASANTRAKITQFVERYFKGNILMTMQPLGQTWKPPANAKIFIMQPLQLNQITAYLLSRQPFLPKTASVQGAAYEQACHTFLANSWGAPAQLSIAEQEKAQIVLSNPLELSLAALLIANNRLGNSLDLRNLRAQQYKAMAEDYRATWNREFPMQSFADAVYQLWLDEKTCLTLPAADFANEVVCMADEKFRMAVSRRWQDHQGDRQEWSFRHDKIAEFFIAQTFRDGSEAAQSRVAKHLGDSSFSGVYLLLATLLPLPTAYQLREDLIQYAAKTGDHTVSDAYVQLLPPR